MVAIAAVLAFACGSGEREVPPEGVVLWESGRVEPRFPVPPEAAWEEQYQRLFSEHQDTVGGDVRWVCYSTADPELARSFYVEVFGTAPEWRPEHPETWLTLVERVIASADIEAPAAPPEGTRWLRFPQRDDLPAVILHTPFFDVSTGLVSHGALVVLRWQEQESG